MRVVLQLLTPVAVRSHRRIVVVPRRPLSYRRTVVSCRRNCRLGLKPNNRRRRLCRIVSLLSIAALLSRVTRHSRRNAGLIVALCKLE